MSGLQSRIQSAFICPPFHESCILSFSQQNWEAKYQQNTAKKGESVCAGGFHMHTENSQATGLLRRLYLLSHNHWPWWPDFAPHGKNSTSRLTHAPSRLGGNPPSYTWKARDLKEAKHRSQSKQWDRMRLDTKHGHSWQQRENVKFTIWFAWKDGNELKNVWLTLSNYSCTRECDLQGWRT